MAVQAVQAVLFGAIGTLAESSDIQRRAYNRAFAEADLDWVWDMVTYRRMLQRQGGVDRIARYADDAGDVVQPERLHDRKRAHFAHLVAREGLALRHGVRDLIAAARRRDVPVAFCTTTKPEQVDIVLDGLAPAVSVDDFAWIGDATRVAKGKPAPDVFLAALDAMDVPPEAALAIEDTPESAAAALAAGIKVVGFPGEMAEGREFQPGVLCVERLQPCLLDMSGPRMQHAAE